MNKSSVSCWGKADVHNKVSHFGAYSCFLCISRRVSHWKNWCLRSFSLTLFEALLSNNISMMIPIMLFTVRTLMMVPQSQQALKLAPLGHCLLVDCQPSDHTDRAKNENWKPPISSTTTTVCLLTCLYCKESETQNPAAFSRLPSGTQSLVNCPKDDPSAKARLF